MRYLFDTDIVSNLLKKRPHPALLDRIKQVPAANQFVSSITVFELYYGAYKSGTPSKYLTVMERSVLPWIAVLDFDDTAARMAGRIRAARENAGRPIAPLDLQIAATAMANGCVLVTGNTRHFESIDGLEVENWLG